MENIQFKEQSKGRLLNAALKLFGQKGYAATSVREILKEANTTAPCLYYHFGNKEGLFLELVRAYFTRIDLLIEFYGGVSVSARKKIKDLLDKIYCQILEDIEFIRILNAIYFSPTRDVPPFDFKSYLEKFHRLIVQIITEAIRKGEFHKGNPDDMAYIIRGVLRVAIEDRIIKGKVDINRKRLQKMLDLILDGFTLKRQDN